MPTTLRNTDILFNDGTTQSTAGGAVNTTTVLNATAGMSWSQVGSYAWVYPINVTINPNGTIAASNFRMLDTNGYTVSPSPAYSGTWRSLGMRQGVQSISQQTLMIRIS